MAKVHIVKELFSLDGKDYPRGTEITDPVTIEKVRERFPKHVVPHHHEAALESKVDEAEKPDTAKAK